MQLESFHWFIHHAKSANMVSVRVIFEGVFIFIIV